MSYVIPIALAHAVPVVVVGFVAKRPLSVHIAGAIMCGVAFVSGNVHFVVPDLIAIGLAWAGMAKARRRERPRLTQMLARQESKEESIRQPPESGSGTVHRSVPARRPPLFSEHGTGPAPPEPDFDGGYQRRRSRAADNGTPAGEAAGTTGSENRQALRVGSELCNYRIARVLGVGGFGITYLCGQGRVQALHPGGAGRLAIKEYLPNEIAVRDGNAVLPKSARDREQFEWGLRRFLDEARTLARFKHRNVVRVRDCFETNNTAYIVMDYEEGKPLDHLLAHHGTLTEGQLRRLVEPVVDGLQQVHAAGFLHRDIKPSNIFVRRADESPVLLDFGSARQALGHRSMSMTAIASAGYSPPEQYESDGEQGQWTDIYALSALCYRAISGKPPIEATRRQSQLLRSGHDPLPRLVDSMTGWAPRVLEAVDWGLRVIPTDRPQHLDEWLACFGSVSAKVTLAGASSTDRETAGTGRAEHHFALGRRHARGDGLAQDDRKAALWFAAAADEGHPKAQTALAYFYANGRGVPKDPKMAVSWYRKAAMQGDAEAQFSLARRYHQDGGHHLPKDDVQAYAWAELAAAQGHAKAKELRSRLEQRMAAGTVEKAKGIARQLRTDICSRR